MQHRDQPPSARKPLKRAPAAEEAFAAQRIRELEERNRELEEALRQARAVGSTSADPTQDLAVRMEEDRYRQLSQEFHAILDAIPETLVLQSADHRVVWANRGAALSVGKKAADLIGRHCYALWHGLSAPCPACPVQETFRTGAPASGEVTSPEGRRLRLRAVPIKDAAGRVTGVVELGRDITEHKRAGEALRESERRFRAAFEEAPDAALLLSAEGLVLDANGQAGRELGYAPEEFRRLHVGSIDARLGSLLEDPAFWQALRDGADRTVETEHRCKGGRLIPVEVRVSLVQVEERPCLLAFCRNLTERKRAEEASRLEESRLGILLRLNEMADATEREITDYALEESLKLTGSGVGYIAFLNEGESELTMDSWSKTAVAECAIPEKQRVYKISATGLWGEAVRQRRAVVTNDYEAPNPLKKGYPEGHVAIRNHLNLPVIDGGRIVAVAGVGNKLDGYDASDVRHLTLLAEGMWQIIRRKRAEAERSRLIAILETTSDIVATADAEGNLRYLNRAGRSLLGIPEGASLESVRVSDLQPRTVAPTLHTEALPRAREVGLWRGESAFRSADHRIIPVSQVVMAHRDETGAVRYLSTIARDITDRKRAEEQREDILRAVSHDLRTPLIAVGGFAALLLRQREQAGADERELTYLKHMAASTKLMDGMIRDLVDSVRLEAGGAASERQPVALGPFLREFLGRYEGALAAERVRTEIPGQLPDVCADAERLERILTNLLTNALKYSAPGSEVTVRAEAREQEVVVSVCDRGPGIPPEELPRVFQRFYRARAGTRKGGIGLGLHITKLLVEAQGGRIWAQSREGEGSTFCFALPRS
jgi:PAS domain S-box-containing protein